MENELNVRLQHAVEHDETIDGVTTQLPSYSSVPKDGEIIFNRDRTNFKVGNGNNTYSQLNNFLKTIAAASGADIGDVGTPSVTTSTVGDTIIFTFHQLKGEQGEQGDTGDTGVGISTITKTGTSGLVDTYTITYTNGNTSTYTITNGVNGTDGNSVYIAYADDEEGSGFSIEYLRQKYIGTYIGTEQSDDPSVYTWAKFVGEDGGVIQADWAQTNNTASDYIKNKPVIPSGYLYKVQGSGTFSNWISSQSSEIVKKKGAYINISTLTSEQPSGQSIQSGYLGCLFTIGLFDSLEVGQEFKLIFGGNFPSGYHTLYFMVPKYSIYHTRHYYIIQYDGWSENITNYYGYDIAAIDNKDKVITITVTKWRDYDFLIQLN